MSGGGCCPDGAKGSGSCDRGTTNCTRGRGSKTPPLGIHVTGIFTYIYHEHQPNVGTYTSPMDGMGHEQGVKFS